MATPRLTEEAGSQPEVRLELTNAEGRQVWALYSERPYGRPPEPSTGNRFLEDLLATAWRWRRRIAAAAGIGAVLGVVYLVVTPSIYVVRALVHIEQRDSVLQHYDAVRAGSTFIATQSEVLHSPSIVRDTFDAMGGFPTPEPGLLKRLKKRVRSWLPRANGAPADPQAAAVMAALAALDATPVVGTDVMAITFRTADPQHGVAFLDALIGRFRVYVRELETRAHEEGLALLRSQDAELGVELARLQARWEELHAETPSLGGGDADALSVQKMRLEEAARASVAALGRRIELQNRLVQLRQNGAPPASERDRLVDELRLAEATLAELRATVSQRHPDVRRMEQKIALLREQIERNAMAQVDELERELRAARRTEQQLQGLYDAEWSQAKEIEVQRQRENEVGREIERVAQKRDAVVSLLRDKELQVLSLQSGHTGTLVRVLDPPVVPPEAVWPVPGVVLLVFAALGGLVGLGLALYAERKLRGRVEDVASWSR